MEFQIIIKNSKLSSKLLASTTLEDPQEPFTEGSFPALQFNPSRKPFVAFGIVPIAVTGISQVVGSRAT
ncbi:MAG: hypothetical protein WCG50_16080 [Rhodoferax sp.]|uniref:hypothetical protein n=1 Tax=Rhodoferax sp. TaxID=50421 RepID=UPI0030178853